MIKNDSHRTVAKDEFSHIKGNDHSTVDGEKRESIGGDLSLIANGSQHSKQDKNQLIEAGSEIHHKAGMKIVIEAGAEVTLKAGGSFVKVDPSGVTVSGPMVKLNSGGGPGSGAGASAQVPEIPDLIDAAKGARVRQDALRQPSTRINAGPDSVPATALTSQVRQTRSRPTQAAPVREGGGQDRLADVKGRDSEQGALKSTSTSGKSKTV